jgi:S1-C subfamily serine protease
MNELQALSNDLSAAVERAARAVFGVEARARLGSSGVHWRRGLIVTADHTVQVDEEVRVIRPDGRAVTATVAGRDPSIDIAVLKVDVPDVAVAELAPADTVRVGHIVLALGAGPRASWGVVSAQGARGAGGLTGDLLHLDLTLYPGFSGGPLVDVHGRVAGITTSGASRHLQLAIPAAAVDRVVDELGRRGRIPRAYLGVSTQPVRLPETLRRRLGVDQETAVVVVEVQAGSPAADAGLQIGDVVVALGGIRIADPIDLRTVLRPERVGESIVVSVVRGGEPRDLALRIGERPRRA